MLIRPVLQALVLADHIYIDMKTGKKVIAGTFNHYSVTSFPTEFSAQKFAFISLTEVRGEVPIEVRFVDLYDNHVLVEMKNLIVQAHDPLDTVEMVVELPPLPIPHPGTYVIEVHAAGELLGSLRLLVSPRGETEPGRGRGPL